MTRANPRSSDAPVRRVFSGCITQCHSPGKTVRGVESNFLNVLSVANTDGTFALEMPILNRITFTFRTTGALRCLIHHSTTHSKNVP